MYANGYTRAFSCLHRILKKTQTNKHTRKNQLTDYEGKGSGGITQMHLTSYK